MHRWKIVLDFDGTIYRLFTHYPLTDTVRRLSECMERFGIAFPQTCDAFDAFAYVSASNLDVSEKQRLLTEVDRVLVQAETEALGSGVPIAGFRDFLDFAREEGLELGIVSNNSAICIQAFLKQYGKDGVIPIVGRDALHPEWMKPHPHMLEEMGSLLACNGGSMVFVGDHIRDYECAERYGASFIAMTPTARKYERMVAQGLDTDRIRVARDFLELISLVRELL